MRTNLYRQGHIKRLQRRIRRNITLIAMGALLVAGMVVGLMVLRDAGVDTLSFLVELLDDGRAAAPVNFWESFRVTLAPTLGLLLLLFFLGLCAVSPPVIVLVPLLKGMGFAVVAGYYMAQGLSQWRLVALRLFPEAFSSSIVILLGASCAMRMSLTLFRSAFLGQAAEHALKGLQIYCVKFILLLLAAGLFGAVSALLGVVSQGMI